MLTALSLCLQTANASGLTAAKKLQDSQMSKQQVYNKLKENHNKIIKRFVNRLYPISYQVYLDAKKSGLVLKPIKPFIATMNFQAKQIYGSQTWISKSLDNGYFGETKDFANGEYQKDFVFAIKGYGLVDIRGYIDSSKFMNSDTAGIPSNCKYYLKVGLQGKTISCNYMLNPKNKNALVSIIEKLLVKDMKFKSNEKAN